MKRMLAAVLSVVLAAMLAFPAFAAEIQPRWDETTRIQGSFDISTSATASFNVQARADGANKLVLAAVLQKDDGGGWEDVKIWSTTANTYSVTKTGTRAVQRGAEYQLAVSVDVYVDGAYVETAEETFYYGYFS